jgi:hypothetical protein
VTSLSVSTINNYNHQILYNVLGKSVRPSLLPVYEKFVKDAKEALGNEEEILGKLMVKWA